MRIYEAKEEVMKNSLTMRIEYQNGNPLYIGYAEPGAGEDEPKWQIRKIEYDDYGNPIAVKFAEGTIGFDKVWNDRASYTYS